MTMRVLVTGANGLLGMAIVDAFSGEAHVHAADHGSLDITNASAVDALVGLVRPDVIVNCAAYNDVDRAEEDPQSALQVNALGVQALARAACANDAILVHYSTDFVFDGETDRPYTEDDRPRPLNVYAASKLLGDWFTADAGRHYVLRVESLFGPRVRPGARRSSLGTIVDRIAAGHEVPVFIDRVVSPSYTPDVAHITRELLRRRAESGLYHCVNDGAATWAQVAAEAARLMDRPLRIREITLASAPLKAPRPRFCALSNRRLAALGIELPSWQHALRRFVLGQRAS
jgi:dTDP-4-dehydrorhamnose reductase